MRCLTQVSSWMRTVSNHAITNIAGGGSTAHNTTRRCYNKGSDRPEEGCTKCRDLELQLRERDALIQCLLDSAVTTSSSAAAPLVSTRSTSGTSSGKVVRDDQELEAALRDPACTAVALLPKRKYCIWAQPLRLERKSVLLFGDETSIECALVLKHAKLEARGIHFVGSDASRVFPIVDAGFDSHVCLNRCALSGGRDGLYLSNGSTASLVETVVSDNVRGVFEGLQCRITEMKRCKLRNNLFHAVLLGDPQSTHIRAEGLCRSVDNGGCGNDFDSDSARADFAFSYNPMADVYTDCLHDGRPVVLTAEGSTANLCDPLW